MLTVTWQGLDQVLAWLDRTIAGLTDLTPALEAGRQEAYDQLRAVFSAQAWAPLRPMTVAKRGTSGPILVESGALRDSYLGGGGSVTDRGPTWVEVGSALPYARPHEEGYANWGFYPGGGPYRARWMRGTPVVARPVMRQFQPSAADAVLTAMGEAVVRGWQ